MRFACGALLLAVLAACDLIEPGGDDDPNLCPQTYEFSNHGCARVEGTVLGAAGEPVGGAYVSLLAPPDGERGGYNTPVHATGADGRFRLEIHRFVAAQAPADPDTVTMYLRADAPQDGLRPDSVAVVMRFMPVGAPAVTVQQDIRLP